MLVAASFVMWAVCQPAPQLLVVPKRIQLVLRLPNSCELRHEYAVNLQAGVNRLTWRPDVENIRADDARIEIDGGEDVRLLESAVEGNQAVWKISAGRACSAALRVCAPVHDAKWSLKVVGALAGGKLFWRPLVSVELSKGGPIMAHEVLIEGPGGTELPLHGLPLILRGGHKVSFTTDFVPIAARLVYRYRVGDKVPHRIALLEQSEDANLLTYWGINSIQVTLPKAAPFSASLIVSAERGMELDLGPTDAIAVRRIVMDEQRKNLDFDSLGRVQGYDTVETIRLAVSNLSSVEAEVEVVEEMLSAWEIKIEPPADLSRPDEAVIRLKLQPGQTIVNQYTLIKHSGSRIKP